MSVLRTDLIATRESARRLRFEPTGAITETNVQKAIEQSASQPQAIAATSITVADSPYTVAAGVSTIYADSSGGPITINLQAAAVRAGVPLTIKDVGGAGSSNNITITPSGVETIDGLTSLVINSDYGGYRLNPRTASYTLAP